MAAQTGRGIRSAARTEIAALFLKTSTHKNRTILESQGNSKSHKPIYFLDLWLLLFYSHSMVAGGLEVIS